MQKFKRSPPQEYLLRIFSYDPITGVVLNRETRSTNAIAGTVVGSRGKRHLIVSLGGKKYVLHRIIWKMVTGCDPVEQIDHRSVDGFDNSWINLREATQSQNQANRRPITASGLKGVRLYRNGRWQCQITVGKKNIHLGYFSSKREAHAVYMAKAIEVFGEFARAA